jgi:hypothetical protein
MLRTQLLPYFYTLCGVKLLKCSYTFNFWILGISLEQDHVTIGTISYCQEMLLT